ncbi:MAG TPA: metal-dependent transcriptional regulator [Anaerolineaceae bacterium]|jgi:DtxR family Mn-dependent transcriptional regulator
MRYSEDAQERLELIWDAMQEDGSTSRLPPQAGTAKELAELIGLGLVNEAGSGLSLTPVGKTEAALAVRRHRLAERLLADVLATDDSLVDERACGLEHALFDGVDESICTLLGHPQFCPHGKPIPPGQCCQEMRASVGRLVAPLCELKPGSEGQIAYIHMNNPQRLQKLMAMGVLPGVPLRVLRDSPSFVFEAGYSQFAVDEDIAADIYVRLKNGH